ncbi:hypothetical protein EEI45_00645 [Erysipelothrix piscisicarius]|uniref:Uncharacterized protein n=1 Tax=Erysipelothrix piscisicarius TaxID=2485784 RepID=A0A3Q8S6K0_9FIRM|nr:hypothetical protein [Erysipelothrix piscisicarius]AZK43514.1 hypothetical protein EEI45_00645 [Erysipelothrix piscisicarius]
MTKFNENSTLEEVLTNEEGLEIATKHLGSLLERPVIKQFKHKTLAEVETMIPVPAFKKKVSSLIEELTENQK